MTADEPRDETPPACAGVSRSPGGHDYSHLTPEEFEDLLGFWIRVSDGEKLPGDEHARFRALDAKVIKRGDPYSYLTDAELDEAIEQHRARGG